jgi:hypothetical protein
MTLVLAEPAGPILAPCGLDTPGGHASGLTVSGGRLDHWKEPATGQRFARIAPQGGPLTLVHRFDGTPAPYPAAVFDLVPSRYTIAAEALLEELRDLRAGNGPDKVQSIACAVARRFDYGHPTQRFYDGHHDSLPALGCERAEGSCVDINLYFMAALRAAGIATGYVAGAFFPAEKGDWCSDMHCWVVTCADGRVQEWDVAHHLKLGLRDVEPGLNPKPGFRVPLSFGVALRAPGGAEIRALSMPVAANGAGPLPRVAALSIRLGHPAIPPGPVRPVT